MGMFYREGRKDREGKSWVLYFLWAALKVEHVA
jgi:hypothetical protein